MTKLRDGVIKRGNTWSYVVRVADPRTGVSRPRWVGGFPTEGAAKSGRDEARRRARRGEYVDRSSITVAAYLGQWLAAHSLETKPRTLAGDRWLVDRYVIPRMGAVRLQAVRPSDLSTLYRGADGPRHPAGGNRPRNGERRRDAHLHRFVGGPVTGPS